jgi:hypothetical protein
MTTVTLLFYFHVARNGKIFNNDSISFLCAFTSVPQLLLRERSDLFGEEGGLPGAQENNTK